YRDQRHIEIREPIYGWQKKRRSYGAWDLISTWLYEDAALDGATRSLSTRGLARVEKSFLQIQIERKSNMKQAIAIAALLLAGVASTAAQSPTSNRTGQELNRLPREV